MANRMLMVRMVKPIAIKGETSAIVLDRSARFSSTNCMSRFLLLQTASAHQQAELLAVRFRGRKRRREAAVEHHCDPVGDLGEFIQVLAPYHPRTPPARPPHPPPPDHARPPPLP